MRGRRALVGTLASAWLAGALARAARASPDGDDEAARPDHRRAALVAAGEAALARGDAIAASETFEQAGAMRHAADSEMGLVRAAMQLGDYRRALAFAAHVAGEHLDAPGAAVLYAWLLQVGGRHETADRVLREALERAPGDPVLAAAVTALAAPLPVASAALLALPHRVAPVATRIAGAQSPPVEAGVVSSGVLLPGGRHALVPGRPRSSRLWVRNGLGATSEATLGDGSADGIATLCRLTTTIEGADDIVIHPPVPGTRVFAIEYAETSAATPAWPWLRAGFLGAALAEGKAFRLGAEMAASRAGGPVLDRAGRLVGVAMRDVDGRITMCPAAPRPSPTAVGEDTTGGRGASSEAAVDLAFDQLYERALRVAIQVIAVS